jgi:hypothetical protein
MMVVVALLDENRLLDVKRENPVQRGTSLVLMVSYWMGRQCRLTRIKYFWNITWQPPTKRRTLNCEHFVLHCVRTDEWQGERSLKRIRLRGCKVCVSRQIVNPSTLPLTPTTSRKANCIALLALEYREVRIFRLTSLVLTNQPRFGVSINF